MVIRGSKTLGVWQQIVAVFVAQDSMSGSHMPARVSRNMKDACTIAVPTAAMESNMERKQMARTANQGLKKPHSGGTDGHTLVCTLVGRL